jgi:hypothetical protein
MDKKSPLDDTADDGDAEAPERTPPPPLRCITRAHPAHPPPDTAPLPPPSAPSASRPADTPSPRLLTASSQPGGPAASPPPAPSPLAPPPSFLPLDPASWPALLSAPSPVANNPAGPPAAAAAHGCNQCADTFNSLPKLVSHWRASHNKDGLCGHLFNHARCGDAAAFC